MSDTGDVAAEQIGGDEAAGVVGPASLTPFHKGAPAAIGVPLFVVGSIALGLSLIGFVPSAVIGGPIAIILTATGLFELIAAIWCIALGESIVGSIFGIFAGFWISYAALVLGLLHNWYEIKAAADVTHTVELFLICWLAVIVALTLATFRLPLAFSAIFVLVDVALVCVLIGTIQASQEWHTIGGYVVFAFAAVGFLVYFDTMSQAFGGKPVPLGRPIQR